jgi:hypothetical protein
MNESQDDTSCADDPMKELFGNVIYEYSRKQAIEDGVLVDVSQTAKEAGFKWPFAMTAEVWNLIENIPEKFSHEDIQGRLWDVLTMARHAIANSKPCEEEILFDLILHQSDANRLGLKLLCGPGDDTSPVLTLMLPDQD